MKKQKKNIPFGLHLMMDLYNCSPKVLEDKTVVYNLLNTLPEKLGMKKLIEPVVLFAQHNGKKDPGGWSGFVMIQESHISIHTFIKRRFVTMDIYSCKQFDTQKSIADFINIFKPQETDVNVEVRGKKYPAEDIE